jgi:hypothetical protein
MKNFLRAIAVLLVVVLVAFGIFWFTDSRYSLAAKSYLKISSADAASVEFDASGGRLMGVSGTMQVDNKGDKSMTDVTLSTSLFALAVSIYTEGEDAWVKTSFSQDWIKAEKGESTGGIEIPAEKLKEIKVMDVLKVLSQFDRTESGDDIILSTTDAFTTDQLKEALATVIPNEYFATESWNIKSYEMKMVFSKSTKLIKSVGLTTVQEMMGMDIELKASAALKGLGADVVVTRPSDLP